MNAVVRNVEPTDWISILLIGTLFVFTVSRALFPSVFKTFLSLPFNNNYLLANQKKSQFLGGFHLLTIIFQLMNLSLFILMVRKIFWPEHTSLTPFLFLSTLALLVGFLTFKIILQLGNGYFFDNFGIMLTNIYEKLSFLNYSGLIAFVANITLTYVLPGNKTIVLVALALIFAILSTGIIKALILRGSLVGSNPFYFILYLCALEIAPLIILISFLNV